MLCHPPRKAAMPRFSSSFANKPSRDDSDQRRRGEVGGMAISLFLRQQGHECSGRRDRLFLPRPPDLNWDYGVDSKTLAERVMVRTVARSAPTATEV